MSSLHDRIAQFRKMATEAPDDELGHFRLGQLLMEDGQFAEAIESFEKTRELSPQFSKVYQLMGECHAKLDQNEQAIAILTQGYGVATERGDKIPASAMESQLAKLGAPIPKVEIEIDESLPDTGFRCQRPGCPMGRKAQQLPFPPITGEVGEQIYEKICSNCWRDWLGNTNSVKVVNELRLDLSAESGQAEYDRYMREFFGFEEEANG